MKRLGYIMIIGYSLAVMVTQYWVQMASSSGFQESGPWVLAMGVAVLFVIAAAFKLFRGVLEAWSAGNDEVDVGDFDVPDMLVFGLFTLFIVANLVAHGVLAALSGVAGSIWYGGWFLGDLIIGLVSFVVWKSTARAALRSRQKSGGGPRMAA